jgi:hypothetical protein
MGRTSVVDREKRRSAEALLQYIGLSPPLKATDSRRAPGSTLTRVNVLNRYLGYKACKYETKWAPSPNNPASGSNVGEAFGQPKRQNRAISPPFEEIRRGHQQNSCLNPQAEADSPYHRPIDSPTKRTRFKFGGQAAEF